MHTVLSNTFIPIVDVEHAAGEAGKQLHASSTPVPHLQYEGFEPSPYDKNDARADYEEQLVRCDNGVHSNSCSAKATYRIKQNQKVMHRLHQSSSLGGFNTHSLHP